MICENSIKATRVLYEGYVVRNIFVQLCECLGISRQEERPENP